MEKLTLKSNTIIALALIITAILNETTFYLLKIDMTLFNHFLFLIIFSIGLAWLITSLAIHLDENNSTN